MPEWSPEHVVDEPLARHLIESQFPALGLQLARLERAGLWRSSPRLAGLLRDARSLPATAATSFVHGDLHVRHVLVAEDGSLTGIIDWGDLCLSDPCVDLALFWCFLPAGARAAFLDAYGPVTDEQLLRARVLAVFLSATLALYGHEVGLERLEREAVLGLALTLEDEP